MIVSRETSDRLRLYADLVRKWSPKINLVSRADLESLDHRHLEDCRQLPPLVPQGWTSWCDMGSGGGFPGIVVAISARQGQRVTMIEADLRKATFLRTVIRDLGLPAAVLDRRIEDAPPQAADIVSARALAPLPRLLELASRHGRPETTYVFPKGKGVEAEIDAARADWDFSIRKHPSRSDPDATILVLEHVQRA